MGPKQKGKRSRRSAGKKHRRKAAAKARLVRAKKQASAIPILPKKRRGKRKKFRFPTTRSERKRRKNKVRSPTILSKSVSRSKRTTSKHAGLVTKSKPTLAFRLSSIENQEKSVPDLEEELRAIKKQSWPKKQRNLRMA